MPATAPQTKANVEYKDGFYFVRGSGRLIYKRTVRKRISQKKIKIAKKATRVISLMGNVKMVGISGSLAMENAEEGGDIDLMIITKKGKLWTTRVVVYFLLKLFGFFIRTSGKVNQKDGLCLNIWLDESDMVWNKEEKNYFTAHEILQIIPLFNKNKTYENFLLNNKWALDFWPNVVDIKYKNKSLSTKLSKLGLIDSLAFKAQYLYMKPKITRELITQTRAIFHPNDLSAKILAKIST
jgi:D-beta-D-heptose 7-phosphate kinase/D-beta-D-heptose 1-phosphate adenosyltransferase